MPGQTTFTGITDQAPRAGQVDGIGEVLTMPGAATAAISFGDALEWVSESAGTVKLFDGTGTICGFAARDLSRPFNTGYVAGDQVPIVFRGGLWINTAAPLTVGAAVAGVANSVVRKVGVNGAQNLALVYLNLPARGPAL